MILFPGHIVKLGSSDSASIALIKERLNILGFGPLHPSNKNFGPNTKEAVKSFQKANQLIQDGIVGELTWERLFTISIIQPATSVILRIRAVQIADTQLFVRELTGRNDGKEVEEYLATIGLGPGFAWCMAFVYWAFVKASDALNMTNPVPRTGGVLDCYSKAKHMDGGEKLIIVKEPKSGDQGIMDFGHGKGHTFLVNEVRGKNVFTVEGNTKADPTYQGEDREGNGVFERLRPISSAKAFIRYF